MSVRLRLARFGRIHRPFYRIGAFDGRTRRNGAALEYLGYYDPLETTGQRVRLDKEAIIAWLEKGAIPSETVASFLKQEGIPFSKRERKTARNKARMQKRKAARAAKAGRS